MRHRVVDGVLLLVIVAGGALAGRAAFERSRLGAEYRRLADKTGEPPIRDASKVVVSALETGEPLHFAWRVHLPPNYRFSLWHSDGSYSSGWQSSAVESIARVRFREDEQGCLHVYTRFSGGASRMQVDGPALADLLRDRWHEIEADQLGAGGPVVLDADQPTRLLRLTLSQRLQDDARTALPDGSRERHVPVLFDLHLGPKPPGR